VPDDDELEASWRDISPPRELDEVVEFAIDDTLDVDRLLAVYHGADADLVRAIVSARAVLMDHLVPRGASSNATVGPLLVAVRALEHALVLAVADDADPALARWRRLNAAALVVLVGSASVDMVQNLRGVGAVADAVEVTLRQFMALWRRARSPQEVATLWDSAAIVLSAVLPGLEHCEPDVRRTLIGSAVLAFLRQGDPQRPPGEWSNHVAALLRAGGIDVASGNSLRSALHQYRRERPASRR
jgi:hypothetical protein